MQKLHSQRLNILVFVHILFIYINISDGIEIKEKHNNEARAIFEGSKGRTTTEEWDHRMYIYYYYGHLQGNQFDQWFLATHSIRMVLQMTGTFNPNLYMLADVVAITNQHTHDIYELWKTAAFCRIYIKRAHVTGRALLIIVSCVFISAGDRRCGHCRQRSTLSLSLSWLPIGRCIFFSFFSSLALCAAGIMSLSPHPSSAVTSKQNFVVVVGMMALVDAVTGPSSICCHLRGAMRSTLKVRPLYFRLRKV